MSVAIDLLSWALLLAGGAFCVIGGLGLVRLRGFFPRTHASSVARRMPGSSLYVGTNTSTVRPSRTGCCGGSRVSHTCRKNRRTQTMPKNSPAYRKREAKTE